MVPIPVLLFQNQAAKEEETLPKWSVSHLPFEKAIPFCGNTKGQVYHSLFTAPDTSVL